jgi:hypothetical protein
MFMKKRKQPKKRLKKIAKFHAAFSVGLFILYIALSLIYSPEFFLSDIRHKFRALADDTITIMATVMGPPVKPIVSGTAVCNSGSLSVSLDWPDDKNSESFDIDRNSLPLITGLTSSQYSDEAVTSSTAYTYIVTARGQMGPGSAASDPITITTPGDCGNPLPAPNVRVTAFAGKSVSSYDGTPASTQRRPIFSGTTNIPNANIYLLIPGDMVISANISANINGYWSWRPPINIAYGTHSLFVSATDPLNPGRIASATFTFRIRKEKEKEEEKQVSVTVPVIEPKPLCPVAQACPAPAEVAEIPLDFSLTVKPEAVFQGKKLATLIRIEQLDPQYEGEEVIAHYTIFDEKGERRINILENITLRSKAAINRDIPIPVYFKDGQYRIRAEIILDRYNVSREQNFSVVPLPILNLGGGFIMTYPEFLSKLGTASLWLLFILIIWLILFYREYWLQLHALRHITEQNLARMGLLGTKRGKGVSR